MTKDEAIEVLREAVAFELSALGEPQAYEARLSALENALKTTATIEAPTSEAAAEVLALHQQLAHEKLRADQGWERYEAANRDRNALRAAKISAQPAADHAPVPFIAWEVARHDTGAVDDLNAAEIRETWRSDHATRGDEPPVDGDALTCYKCGIDRTNVACAEPWVCPMSIMTPGVVLTPKQAAEKRVNESHSERWADFTARVRGGDFEKLAAEGGSYTASCGMPPTEALARARELMAGAEDAAILKYALDALTAHFNEFVGACMTPDGEPVAPRKKDLMQARACLPSSCSHGFKPR